MLFIKWQNHNLADGTYINHYSTNARILNLIILYIWPKWHCTLVQEMACRFQCWKNLSCLTSPISPLLFLWIWKGLLLKKKIFSDAGIFLSWGSILWSFFSPAVPSISVNLPYCLAWNTVVISGLVLLATTWIY